MLVTSEIFTHVRRYGVEFHRREDAQRSLETPRPTPTRRVTSSHELLVATDVVTDANPAGHLPPGTRGSRVTRHRTLGRRARRRCLTRSWAGAARVRGVVTLGNAAVGHVSRRERVGVGHAARQSHARSTPLTTTRLRDVSRVAGLRGPRFDDLDTALLADGRGISTGEKVRLVLARALLAHPELLVLDDVAGVLDDDARRPVRATARATPAALAIVEATVDTPLLIDATLRIELSA